MNYYYILSDTSRFDIYKDYIEQGLKLNETNKSIEQIQYEILSNENFCHDNSFISNKELKSYIVSGISFFCEDEQGNIAGLVNFDINYDTIILMGICVPLFNKGIGSCLIKFVKKFAKLTSIKKIKLTCYGNVKDYYEKKNFNIVSSRVFYDSDDEEDSDEENEKEKKKCYGMEYIVNDNDDDDVDVCMKKDVNNGGYKSNKLRKTRKSNKLIKSRNSRKSNKLRKTRKSRKSNKLRKSRKTKNTRK